MTLQLAFSCVLCCAESAALPAFQLFNQQQYLCSHHVVQFWRVSEPAGPETRARFKQKWLHRTPRRESVLRAFPCRCDIKKNEMRLQTEAAWSETAPEPSGIGNRD